ncbi:MAG: hypothetical protein ACRDIE_03445 [Chloroflexota bacterium]
MKKALKAVSNVIELKSGKTHLLVFNADEHDALQDVKVSALHALDELRKSGFTCFGFAPRRGQALEVE